MATVGTTSKKLRLLIAVILDLLVVALIYSLIRSSSSAHWAKSTNIISFINHPRPHLGSLSSLQQPSDSELANELTTGGNEDLVSVGQENGSTKYHDIFLSILHDARKCSLSLGVSKLRLNLNQATLTSGAQSATLLLQTMKEMLPDNKMATIFRSPCWKTSFKLHKHPELKLQTLKKSLQRRTLASLIEENAECDESNECVHCMPYFFVAGFPKCGTTSLHYILGHHPELVEPFRKEINILSQAPLGDLSTDFLKCRAGAYLQYFEKAALKPDALAYDASPKLLFESPFKSDFCLNAAIVSRILPNAKFIVLIRDPIDRLYSSFFFFSKAYDTWSESMKLNPTLYFHTEVEDAIQKFNGCLLQGNSVYECSAIEMGNWLEWKHKEGRNSNVTLSLGIYYIYILKWSQFYPIESFLFLRTEDMARNLTAVMRNITEFLGIQSVSEESINARYSEYRNIQRSFSKEYGGMMPETRKLLTDFYAPYNKQLVQLIGDKRFLYR